MSAQLKGEGMVSGHTPPDATGIPSRYRKAGVMLAALQPPFCEEGAANHTTSILVNIEGATEIASATKSTLQPDEPYS